MQVFIDPVIFKLGFFELRWYSVAYILGFVIAGFLAIYTNKFTIPQNKLTKEKLDYLLNYCILGVILGGRLGFVLFYGLDYFIRNPMKIFAIWEGGMSFHGGLLGVIAGIALFAKTKRFSMWHLLDRAAFCVLPGLFLGRLANFINGELWGNPTSASFAFIFPKSGDLLPRHPSQLYEALFEGLIPFIIFFILLKTTQLFKKEKAFSGLFLIFYSVPRFVIEQFFREPEETYEFFSLTLSTGQLLCIPMFLLGIALLFFKQKNN